MVHVCYGLYDKTGHYSKFAGTSILSLFDNTRAEVTVHILHDNTLTEENKSKFQSIAEKFNQQIKFYNVEKLCAERINYIKEKFFKLQNARFTFGTMFRLLMPNVLDTEIDRVIYLDADTIVNLDIKDFWEIDLEGNIFAVVPEKQMGVPTELAQLCIDGIVEVEDYFNAGVILIDLKQLQQDIKVLEDGIKFIAENTRYYFFDQDILNYTFSKRTLKLPNKFNRHIGYARRFGDFVTEDRICHYIYGSLKLNMRDDFNRLWLDYFSRSPWFNIEILQGIYDATQDNYNQTQDKFLTLSALMSNRRRIFFAELKNLEGLKKIFKIDNTEEIIDGKIPDAEKILLARMEKFRDRVFLIVLVKEFKKIKDILTAANFVEGVDFIDAKEFLTPEIGAEPLDTNFLILAM